MGTIKSNWSTKVFFDTIRWFGVSAVEKIRGRPVEMLTVFVISPWMFSQDLLRFPAQAVYELGWNTGNSSTSDLTELDLTNRSSPFIDFATPSTPSVREPGNQRTPCNSTLRLVAETGNSFIDYCESLVAYSWKSHSKLRYFIVRVYIRSTVRHPTPTGVSRRSTIVFYKRSSCARLLNQRQSNLYRYQIETLGHSFDKTPDPDVPY